MKEIIVDEIDQNTRIDLYISSKINELSRTTIKRLLEEEKITVNGKNAKLRIKLYLAIKSK